MTGATYVTLRHWQPARGRAADCITGATTTYDRGPSGHQQMMDERRGIELSMSPFAIKSSIRVKDNNGIKTAMLATQRGANGNAELASIPTTMTHTTA